MAGAVALEVGLALDLAGVGACEVSDTVGATETVGVAATAGVADTVGVAAPVGEAAGLAVELDGVAVTVGCV